MQLKSNNEEITVGLLNCSARIPSCRRDRRTLRLIRYGEHRNVSIEALPQSQCMGHARQHAQKRW